MPGGNGMGPAGAGSMTGRAAGFCAGFSVPGYLNPAGSGFGGGFGRGRGGGRGGFGRGFRNMFFATGLPGWARSGVAGTAGAADEKQVLTGQADALRAQLDGIQKRLEQLDSGAAT
ncbi:MAG TPA: DUF5320 domain-containing protein [Kiritimatiellia bacterium]|nr:DUF5320 domain-containing protein [Kiritimatiellia bacterium]HPO36430.1 DUF5320 domain-containing protein [Kiritimatiellia bacterium]HQA39055.1 DUF5320 domain-containing protein [Kiritimatiellia bacterium]